MKVVRLHAPNDLRLHIEPRPEIGPGEVLLRVSGVSMQAVFAGMAWDSWIHSHPFALAGSACDGGSEFVPEHERFLKSCIANAGLAEPVQIRSANANRPDAQQYFTRANFGSWFDVQT
jgi:hypothetical protein